MRVIRSLSRKGILQRSSQGRIPCWQKTSGSKFVILCYHRVGDGGVPFVASVAPQMFDAQMRYLRQHYRVVSLEQVCRELREQPKAQQLSIAITFDDGYKDLYDHATPILQKYNIPATVFLTVGCIESGEVAWYDTVYLSIQALSKTSIELPFGPSRVVSLHDSEARYQATVEIIRHLRSLPYDSRNQLCSFLAGQVELHTNEIRNRMLNWEQVRQMQASGVAFGSHTWSHPVVSQLLPNQIEMELLRSKQTMEDRLGVPVIDFAFPFGQESDCGTEAENILARLGYRSGATTMWGWNAPMDNLYRLRRVQVGGEPTLPLFALRLSQAFLSDTPEPYGEPAPTVKGRGQAPAMPHSCEN